MVTKALSLQCILDHGMLAEYCPGGNQETQGRSTRHYELELLSIVFSVYYVVILHAQIM